jgi:thioredoxin reductase (NADPH)
MSKLSDAFTGTRIHQVFPVLEPFEIDRVRRFGVVRCFDADSALIQAGDPDRGLAIILAGEVEVRRHGRCGPSEIITTHGPGGFMGELAQLVGRPSLVDAYARGPVEALLIAPDRLRALLIAEADLGERIMRALILRRVGLLETGVGGPVIIGRTGDGGVLRLTGFLRRNGHPYLNLDPDTDAEATALIERFHIDPGHLPVVLCPNGRLLRNPGESELARCLGLVRPIDPHRLYDVAIIGAGPAGLAAAVYAGSEGLSVLVCDCRAFGGQAGASSRIENYLGFPTGITGLALMARAYNQAQKFGVEMAIPDEVAKLQRESPDGPFVLTLTNGERVNARSAVIASGARYRRPEIANLDVFEDSSVHFWASPLEGKLCSGQEVVLVGAGNSAGQAVVYLASQAAKVWVLVRGTDLSSSMSRYLVDRIAGLANVEVVTDAQVSKLEGEDGMLRAVQWRLTTPGEVMKRPVRHMFLFIGAEPNTDFLAGSGVTTDAKGFVLTGDAIGDRRPLETSVRGIFAIGDVRSRSVKRVAASVGEGAQVVAALHGFLNAIDGQQLATLTHQAANAG